MRGDSFTVPRLHALTGLLSAWHDVENLSERLLTSAPRVGSATRALSHDAEAALGPLAVAPCPRPRDVAECEFPSLR